MGDTGLPGVAKEAVSDLQRLVKLEAQLAGEQVKLQARRKGMSAGAGAAGALFLLLGFVFALAAAAWALSLVLPIWAGFLIVAGALVVLGGGLGLAAMAGFKAGGGLVPEETKQRIKEDVRWIREQSS